MDFSAIDWSALNIAIELLGLGGLITSVMSLQYKEHSKLMFLRAVNEFLFSLQYFLLKAYNGMAMNIVGFIRDIVFKEMVKKGKSTMKARIIFSAIFVIAGLITFDGFKTIVSTAAKVISSCLYGSSNTKVTRVGVVFTSACWIFYNIAVRSYAGALCDALTLISALIGIIRLDIIKKEKV